MAATTFHVDLSAANNDTLFVSGLRDGSTKYPFTWGQVITWLQSSFVSGMDVVFALTGTKQDAFSAITTQVVGGVDTNCVCQATGITDSRLLFTRDTAPSTTLADYSSTLPAPVPVLGGTGGFTAFVDLVNCANVSIEFTELLLHTTFSASASLVRLTGCSNSFARVHNNIVDVAGAMPALIKAVACTGKSGFGVGFNTVLVRSTSTVAPNPLLDVGNATASTVPMTAWCGGNYIANHSDTTFIVTGSRIGTNNIFFHGSNVFGGTQSFLTPYLCSGTDVVLGTDRMCDWSTQGTVGVSWFDGSPTSYSAQDISGYWPIQGGALLETASDFVNAFTNSSMTVTGSKLLTGFGVFDIYGRTRSGYDVGAVEKNCAGSALTYHVDLSASGSQTVISSGTGSINNPLTVGDMLRLHSRLAPCNNNVTFVLRNSNYNAADTTGTAALGGIAIDLGPRVNSTEYTGSGEITFTGYRTFVKAPPVLVVTQIASNTLVNTKFLGIKVLWSTGSNLFETSSLRTTTGSFVRFVNSVLRSTANCSARITDASATAPVFDFVGSTFDIRHTVDTASGLFVFNNAFANHVFGNAIVMPGTETLVGSGAGTIFDANYINCSRGQFGIVSPVWSFTGNVGSHNTADSVSLESVFTDPEAASGFAAADWSLTGDVATPQNIIFTALVPAEISSLYATDIRGCTRDASTGTGAGAAAGDAGAYEYNYAIPNALEYYVDFARYGSAHQGTRIDRWSYADLKTYLESLSNSVLDAPVVIYCLGTGTAGAAIHIEQADSMPYANVQIKSESPFSLPMLHVELADTWLSLDGGDGLVLGMDSVLVTSAAPYPLITSTSPEAAVDAALSKSKLNIFNSVLYRKEYNTAVITDSTALQASAHSYGTITAGTVSKRFTTDINLTAVTTPAEAAVVLAAAFNNDATFKTLGYEALLVGGGAVAFSGPATLTISSDVLGMTIVDASTTAIPLVQADSSRELNVIGSGVGIAHASGCTRNTLAVHGVRGHVAYSNFTSDTSTTVGTGSVAITGTVALTMGTEYNVAHGFSAVTSSTADTGSVLSTSATASDPLNDSVVITNFTAIGAALNAAAVANLSAAVQAFGVDYDALQNLRSTSTSKIYDAGPVEVNGIELSGSLTDPSKAAITGLTQEGSTWNIRRDTDGFGFKVVGYAIAGTGYSAYAVNIPLPYNQLSKPASTIVTLQQNSFNSGDTLGLVFGNTVNAPSVTLTYNTSSGWSVGATLADTLQNIVDALRSDSTFNTYCYVYVNNNSLVFVSRRFHASANLYAISCSFGIVSSLLFQGGVTSEGPAAKVWPVSAPYAVFDRMETPELGSRGFVVRLDFDECNFPIGQYAVIAECTASAIPGEVGTRCVYAYANVPLHVKHNREVVVKRIIFQF